MKIESQKLLSVNQFAIKDLVPGDVFVCSLFPRRNVYLRTSDKTYVNLQTGIVYPTPAGESPVARLVDATLTHVDKGAKDTEKENHAKNFQLKHFVLTYNAAANNGEKLKCNINGVKQDDNNEPVSVFSVSVQGDL